jgi:hypothetical protein
MLRNANRQHSLCASPEQPAPRRGYPFHPTHRAVAAFRQARIWIASSKKDTSTATLEKCFGNGAAQAVPARKFCAHCARATATRASAKSKLAMPDRRSVGKTVLDYLWIQLFHFALNEKGRARLDLADGSNNLPPKP